MTRARVLVAVCTLPRPTIRSVAAAARCGPTTAHYHLGILRRQGFVTWDTRDNKGVGGSLRPLYRAELPPRHTDPEAEDA